MEIEPFMDTMKSMIYAIASTADKPAGAGQRGWTTPSAETRSSVAHLGAKERNKAHEYIAF